MGFLKSIKIVDVVLLVWFLLLFVPQAMLIPNYNYLWLGCYVFWFIIVLLNINKVQHKDRSIFYIFVGFLLFVVSECLILDRSEVLHNQIDQSQVLFMFFVFCYYKSRQALERLYRVVLLSSPFILYTLIVTISAVLVNPYAARIGYDATDVYDRHALVLGIGGYIFVYMSLMLSIVCFYSAMSISSRYRIKVVLCLLSFALLASLVILSNYFTATIILVLAVIGFWAFKNKKRLMPYLILLLLIMPIYKPIMGTLLDGIAIVVQEEGRSKERINDLKRSLYYGESSETLETREEPTQISINTFKKHPILGAVASSDLDNGDAGVIGKHSVVLDSIATFGLFVGGFYIVLLMMPFIHLYSHTTRYKRKVGVVLFALSYLMLMYNNNLTGAMGFVVYAIFPMSLCFWDELEFNNKQTNIKN